MKIYRIYTEEKNLADLKTLVGMQCKNFTLYHGTGFYLGIEEPAAIIEIVSDFDVDEAIEFMAKSIKTVNRQHSVMITIQEVTCKWV